jgi:3-oxoacyl-[acyl-carrier protein] reductase
MTSPDRSTESAATRRVALVTGGTRGIGLGIASALAERGWALALSGLRDEDAVGAVLDSLRARAADVLYVRSDVSSTADRERLVDTVVERYGAPHALVNNAGRAPRVRADLLEATEASFEEVMRTNLQGPYFLTQQIVRAMLDRKASEPAFTAVVVFVTSVSAEMASANRGEYCVSKAGLAMTARLFASRLADQGFPIYEVRPGIVATDMTAAVRDSYDERIATGLVPERRWGTPADVGRVVAALVSGELPYSTGSVINVDGGLSIPRL